YSGNSALQQISWPKRGDRFRRKPQRRSLASSARGLLGFAVEPGSSLVPPVWWLQQRPRCTSPSYLVGRSNLLARAAGGICKTAIMRSTPRPTMHDRAPYASVRDSGRALPWASTTPRTGRRQYLDLRLD